MKLNPMHMIRSLYDWVVSWAKTRHANTALFTISLAEASFFPIPPDVLLIAMGVGNSKKSLKFAGICLAGSVIGGMLGYYIGMGLWAGLQDVFYSYVPGFTPEKFASVSDKFNENGFAWLFIAGFTPIPYKIFSIAAGASGLNFGIFVLASVISRGLRFFLVGSILYKFGDKAQAMIDQYFEKLTIAFAILFVGGFFVIKALL